MGSYKEYLEQIETWKKQYGVARIPIKDSVSRFANITSVCFRCGKIKPRMQRHHTGNDYMFARMLPDIYAARYIQYHPEDVVKLCNTCHKLAHNRYKKIVIEILDEIYISNGAVISKEWCDERMKQIREVFFNWIATYKVNQLKKKNGKANQKSSRGNPNKRPRKGRKHHHP